MISLTFENVDKRYRALVTAAVEHMKTVVNHEKFREFLEVEINKSNGLEGELSEWKDASTMRIYLQLFPITLNIKTYYTWKSVIGYGLPGDKWIHLNTKFLDRYDFENPVHLMLIGSNLLHEHSHDCGFDHDFYNTKRRKNSLSYVLNRVYERTYRYIYEIEDEPARYVPWWKRLFRL